MTFQEKRRPYIILKWAQTQDGFIAPDPKVRKESLEPHWITNIHSQQIVHQWRSEEMAILVGTNTVLEDNPKLTVRQWAGKSPIRVVLDRELKTPSHFHVMDGSVKTLVFTEKQVEASQENLIYETLSFEKDVAELICNSLYKHNTTSVLIEGGAQTLQTFIDANLWDEARIFKSDTNFGSGISAPEILGEKIGEKKLLNDSLSLLVND